MDDPIRDYITANRDKYTKEAIREQLLAAGHDIASVDEAWQQIEAVGKPATPSRWRSGITAYVMVWFVLGLLPLLLVARSRPLVIPAYLVIGAVLGYLVTRFHVTGWWWLLAAPLVPWLVAGTCLAATTIGSPA